MQNQAEIDAIIDTYPEASELIAASQSQWPRYRYPLLPPTSQTPGDVWRALNPPFLYRDWKPEMRDTGENFRVIPHRGLAIFFLGIPDGSPDALMLATAGPNKNAGSWAECDIVYRERKPGTDPKIPRNGIINHDLTANRQTLANGKWESICSSDPLPDFISRDPGAPRMSSRYVETFSKTVEPIPFLRFLLEMNPGAGLILDCRDTHIAETIALFSSQNDLYDNVLLQFYCYKVKDFSHLESLVNEFHHDSGWKKLMFQPVLMPASLTNIANLPDNSVNYAAMYTAARAWILSIIAGNLNICGLSFGCSAIGDCVTICNQKVTSILDMNNEEVTDPDTQSIFIKDRVVLDLYREFRKNFPWYIYNGLSITYVFSKEENGATSYYTPAFHTGDTKKMLGGQAAQNWQRLAIPGNAFALGFDTCICDRPFDNANAVNKTQEYSWQARDWNNKERNID